MNTKPEPSPYAQHLGRPHVLGLIEGLFPRTLQRADIEDLRQTALVKALKVAHPPATPREWTALVCKIANDTLTDHFRVGATHAKSEAGLCEDADDHAADPRTQSDPCSRIDLEKLLDCLHGLVEAGRITPRQVRIWKRALHGEAQTEIAKDLGLAHSTVRNDTYAARKTLRAFFLACATTAACVAIATAAWWVSRVDRVAGKNWIGPDAAPAASQTTAPR